MENIILHNIIKTLIFFPYDHEQKTFLRREGGRGEGGTGVPSLLYTSLTIKYNSDNVKTA